MAKRPSILGILTDHTSAAAVASPDCRTPNLDALAAGGIRFDRYYTVNAICSPARASLLTGLYPSAHGVWDCTHTQRPEWVDLRTGRCRCFSHRLAAAGYRNAYFGKWHVEQSNRLEDFGWHEYELECSRGRGEPVPGTELVLSHPGYRPYRIAAIADGPRTHPAFDRAIDFLCHRTRPDEPFCCLVSTAEPHDPYVPPRPFFEQYDLERVPLPASLGDELVGRPEIVRRLQEVWRPLRPDQWRRIIASYWAVVGFLDHEVGRLLEALAASGRDADTIVFFTADHGDMMGAHGLLTKGIGTPYEPVYNVPLVFRLPAGRPRGEGGASLAREPAGASRDGNRSHVLSAVDLAPTLLDLCGLEPPPGTHGRSFRAVLAGTAAATEWQDAYAEFFGQRFLYTQRIVWHGRWKFVFNPGGIDELYDLESDPGECRNLAADPAHRSLLLAMTRRMWRRMHAIGDRSLFDSHYGTLRTAAVGPLDEETTP